MIDVFFCRVPDSSNVEREEMASSALLRWLETTGVKMHIVTPMRIGVDEVEFQRSRRIYADAFSSGAEYVVADDDMLIPDGFNIFAAVNALRRSPFSILSLMPDNAVIRPWTPEGYEPFSDAETMEHVSAGGIRFCRKHHIEHWPPMQDQNPGYDAIHSDQIRAEGGRIGYFKNIYATHLGEGMSSIWKPV